MTYRDDLTALSARHTALEHEVAQKTRELDQASRLLEEATARARFPVLANIRVASPCSADWAQMTGDDRSRHCGDCKKHVYNLSDMTRDEAEALIIEKEGRLCVRYFQRIDGTILLKDCAVGVSRKRRRRIVAIGAAAMVASGAAYAYRALTGDGDVMMGGAMAMPEPVEHTMGEMQAMPDEAPPELPDPPERLIEMKGDYAGPHPAKLGQLALPSNDR